MMNNRWRVIASALILIISFSVTIATLDVAEGNPEDNGQIEWSEYRVLKVDGKTDEYKTMKGEEELTHFELTISNNRLTKLTILGSGEHAIIILTNDMQFSDIKLGYNIFTKKPSVVVPDTVAKVSIKLPENKLPENNITLSSGAFASVKKLSEVYIPSGSLQEIPNSCFSSSGLNTIIMPSVEKVGVKSFYNCKELKIVDSAPLQIGSDAFMDCKSLREIKVSTATAVNSKGFANCTSLESVIFDNSGSDFEIGASAFSNTALQSITLPDNLKKNIFICVCK